MNLHCLRLENVKKVYNQAKKSIIIFDNLSVTFKKGKTYAITGSSGVGKSTLLHISAALDEPTSGNIFFDQIRINSLSYAKKNDFINKSLGFVFQNPYLIQELSILENIMLKGLIGGISKNTCKKEALALLSDIGLLEKASSFPAELSGGQLQRVALARALLNKPDFLFADEPTGNLDNATSNQIIDLLLKYQEQCAIGLIISTHDLSIANRMQQIFEIKDRKLREYNTINSIHLNNKTQDFV